MSTAPPTSPTTPAPTRGPPATVPARKPARNANTTTPKWDPIIDPKDWSRVQFELQLRRQASGIPAGTSRPPVTPKYLLSGILRCGKCGRGHVGNQDRRKNYRTYRCPPSAHGGCGGIHIAADTAETAVEETLTTYFEQLIGAMLQQGNGIHDDALLIDTRNSLATAEAATRTTSAAPDVATWLHGTINQRRALIRRYLHGITVQPAPKAHVFNRTHLVRDRLQPHWRTAAELAA